PAAAITIYDGNASTDFVWGEDGEGRTVWQEAEPNPRGRPTRAQSCPTDERKGSPRGATRPARGLGGAGPARSLARAAPRLVSILVTPPVRLGGRDARPPSGGLCD